MKRDEVKARIRLFLGPGPITIADVHRFSDAMVDVILDLAIGVGVEADQ